MATTVHSRTTLALLALPLWLVATVASAGGQGSGFLAPDSARALLKRIGVAEYCFSLEPAEGVRAIAPRDVKHLTFAQLAASWLPALRAEKMSNDQVADVFCGRLAAGMSQTATLLAWGEPKSKAAVDGPGGAGEMWTYERGSVYLIDRKVSSVIDLRRK